MICINVAKIVINKPKTSVLCIACISAFNILCSKLQKTITSISKSSWCSRKTVIPNDNSRKIAVYTTNYSICSPQYKIEEHLAL